jgi:SnoaL-like domain
MLAPYLSGNRQGSASQRTIDADHTENVKPEEESVQDVIERYIACWNQTDPALRRKLIEEVWATGASYTDPLGEAVGRDAIDATIAAVQEQFPGFSFTLLGPVDSHHHQARFTWGLGPDGVEPLVVGFDVAVADGDGRLATVLGFLDRVPE